MKAPLRRAFIAPAPLALLRFLVRPFGYLAFVGALAALSLAAKLLGERDELGYFSARLAQSMWNYPEVTRGGVQAAWLTWVALFVIALSPLDPITSQWDEVVLAGIALLVLYHRAAAAPRDGR
jgi:hypothetical protein